MIEISRWDQLLAQLGINEQEALNAIFLDSEIGCSIRLFVMVSASAYFVPEDALSAINLHQEAAVLRKKS